MLPHIKNSQAGNNRQDPNYKNMFEMYFTIPEALMDRFGNDVAVLTEQVQKITGLGSLDRGPEKTSQKFMGTIRTYLNSKLEDTSHEISVTFALNLRKRVDNYVYKLFKAWNNLCYNKATGETTIKEEYCSDWFKIVIANRAGDIYRQILFHDMIMFGGIDGLDELDYGSSDLAEITIKFASDWADDDDA